MRRLLFGFGLLTACSASDAVETVKSSPDASLDAATDAPSDASPEADAANPNPWPTASCDAPSGDVIYCADIVVCASECGGGAACVQSCLDQATDSDTCLRARSSGACIFDLTAPGAACQHCAGFLPCACASDCPDGGFAVFQDCFNCLHDCAIGDCVAGACF